MPALNTLALAAPQSVSGHWSPRKRELYTYLSQEGYVCDVGRDYARSGILIVTELQKGQTDLETYEQITAGVRELLGKASGGLVVILPEEPKSYQELKTMNEKRHADIVTAIVATDIFDHREKIERLLAKLREQPERHGEIDTAESIRQKRLSAIEAPILIHQLFQSTSLIQGYPTRDALPIIRKEVERILQANPNTLPIYGDRGLFTITLSSVFRDKDEEERAQARAYFGIENLPHQRYSPVSCLVVNWHDEIVRVMHTKTGEEIQRKKVMAPYFLDPNESLSKPLERLDKVFDAYIRLSYQIIKAYAVLDSSGTMERLEKAKFQMLAAHQSEILLMRQKQLNGKISGEEFGKICVEWDRFITEQQKKDMEVLHTARDRVKGMLQNNTVTVRNTGEKRGRNDPCSCGSGRKYKQCCMRMTQG